MIVELSIPNAVTIDASFTDGQGHWGEEYVSDVVDAGIMAGMGDGTFAPDKAMTYG